MAESHAAPQCSRDELIARLERDGFGSTMRMEDGRFMIWFFGHCFLWSQGADGWKAEEL
jgi:hypothetical protein